MMLPAGCISKVEHYFEQRTNRSKNVVFNAWCLEKDEYFFFFFHFMEIFLTEMPKFREKSCSNGEWRRVWGKQGRGAYTVRNFSPQTLILSHLRDESCRLGTCKQPNKSVMTLWMVLWGKHFCLGTCVHSWTAEAGAQPLTQSEAGFHEVLKPEIITFWPVLGRKLWVVWEAS